jgi:hypothetical protein
MNNVRKSLTAVAGVAALALGGSAIAGAASKTSTAQSASSTAAASQQGYGGPAPGGRPPGRHIGANGQQEQALASDVAAKVAAAAKAKVPGATVERTETDVDHGSPYEAHLRKSDGTELEVLVNKDFQVTAVNTMRHP